MTAIFALFVSAVIWGANSPIMKWALVSVPLFSLAFIRFAAATLLLAPFVVGKLGIKNQDWFKIILAAILGITMNVSFFFAGLKLTFAVNAALIIATIPIFTLFAALIFLGEKLTQKLILATISAISGLILIVGPPILTLGTKHLIGTILLILSALSWVGFEVTSKRLFKTYSPKVVTFYSFFIGSLTLLPFASLEFFQNPAWIIHISTAGLVGIFYGAIFSSTIAYFLWQYGLSKLAASQASFFFYLDPVTGILVAVPLLGEKITYPFIAGTILIFAALFLAEHKRKVHPIYQKDRD